MRRLRRHLDEVVVLEPELLPLQPLPHSLGEQWAAVGDGALVGVFGPVLS